MMVNWEFMDDMNPDKAVRLVDELRGGKEVQSTRGPAVCTFKQAERILAGFEDPREGVVAGGGAAGHASLAGLLVSQGRTPTGPVATTEAAQ
jgi:NADH-quinone oxidoreductase subunit E